MPVFNTRNFDPEKKVLKCYDILYIQIALINEVGLKGSVELQNAPRALFLGDESAAPWLLTKNSFTFEKIRSSSRE